MPTAANANSVMLCRVAKMLVLKKLDGALMRLLVGEGQSDMFGKSRTKAEQRRFMNIQDRGCVPCYLEARLQGRKWVPEPCDIHHTQGQNHLLTYGNCPWHHRGIRKNDLDMLEMQNAFGPSLARNPARYRARYGTEEQILAIQNRMLTKTVEQLKP